MELNWYKPAAVRSFEGYAEDTERQDLSEFFYADILRKLPDKAKYHLDDCLRVHPSKRRNNAKASGDQEGPRQLLDPCILNTGHEGECTSIPPEDTPGTTIGKFYPAEGQEAKPYRESYGKDFANARSAHDHITRNRCKGSNPADVD